MTPLRYLFLAGFVALVASTALLVWNPSPLAFVIQLFALVTLAGAFFLHGSEENLNLTLTLNSKIETLTAEWTDTFNQLNSDHRGIRDGITAIHSKLDAVQHEVAVLDAQGGAEELEKLRDRLAIMEVNGGLSNRFTGVQMAPVAEYRPAKKRDA